LRENPHFVSGPRFSDAVSSSKSDTRSLLKANSLYTPDVDVAHPPGKLDLDFDFGWRSGSPLRQAACFSTLALAAGGDCGGHKDGCTNSNHY
jgi:hypothetical protein